MNRRISGQSRKNRSFLLATAVACVFAGLQGCNEDVAVEGSTSPSGESQQTLIEDLDSIDFALAVRGGYLYDEWEDEPEDTAYPTVRNPMLANSTVRNELGLKDPLAAQISDTGSWRCARCHAWDYEGADGQYNITHARYTGSPSILGSAALSVDEIAEFLTNGKTVAGVEYHAYGDYMSADGILAIATFVKYGTLDTNDHIGKYTKQLHGDSNNGGSLYAGDGQCQSCHGANGQVGITDPDDYVGTLADNNPWELLHKIRFGQPGTTMPSSYNSGLSTQDAVDVMTFGGTL